MDFLNPSHTTLYNKCVITCRNKVLSFLSLFNICWLVESSVIRRSSLWACHSLWCSSSHDHFLSDPSLYICSIPTTSLRVCNCSLTVQTINSLWYFWPCLFSFGFSPQASTSVGCLSHVQWLTGGYLLSPMKTLQLEELLCTIPILSQTKA